MAFLDETGLAELWTLIRAEDAKGVKNHCYICSQMSSLMTW